MLQMRPAWRRSRRRRPPDVLRDVDVPADGLPIVLLDGEVDRHSCGRIPTEVERLCLQGWRVIRIDLGSVTFIDAATIGAFVRARGIADRFHGEVRLVNVQGLPLRVLRLLDLDRELIDGAGGA